MDWLKKNWLWLITHILALTPLIWLGVDFWFDNLTINPIQDLTHRTGDAAIKLLILSLACTPLTILFGWRQLLALRKPLGLYAFMYGCLHFLVFAGLDYGFDGSLIWEATFEKRFALVGFLALLIMLPMALTSNLWSMRQLGKKWKRLHQMVYVAAVLAVLHFLWARKLALDPEALTYGFIVIGLLIIRLPKVRQAITSYRRRRHEAPAPGTS